MISGIVSHYTAHMGNMSPTAAHKCGARLHLMSRRSSFSCYAVVKIVSRCSCGRSESEAKQRNNAARGERVITR